MFKKVIISLLLALSIFNPQLITCHETTAIVARAEKVAFNTKTSKVHKLYCKFAKVCTKNCIVLDRKQAYSKGGVPCKVCGG